MANASDTTGAPADDGRTFPNLFAARAAVSRGVGRLDDELTALEGDLPTPTLRTRRPTVPLNLDEMSRIRAVHDLLDVARDLPAELRWALLDYAAGVLEGESRATAAANRAA